MSVEKPVLFDQDNPRWTGEDFARAKPLSAYPELEKALADRSSHSAAAIQASAKRPISLRLDADVIDGFRSTGPGWQQRMNEILRAALRS